MDAAIYKAVEAIHKPPRKFVVVVTGGGATVPGLLLSVPGGSRTVLEAVIPYGEQALVEFLGHRPAQFVSAAASRALADRALDRARWLAPGEEVLGVACTASLVSDRPKRGEHRFHISVHGSDKATTYSVVLHKGMRDRAAEEAVVASVLLNALAEAVGSPERLTPGLLPDESIKVETTPADPLSQLKRGDVPALYVAPDGQLSARAAPPPLLLPGAFNPVHMGHWRLAEAASRMTGKAPAFELSIINVDKPPLTAEEIRRRLHQFAWRWPVWITRAPTFEEKAALFPDVTFAIGADTAERLVAPRYYGDSETRMAEALMRMRQLGCRFIVAGREDRQGKFLGVEQLSLPAIYRDLFTGIPEAEFRVSVSSTTLREEAQKRQTGVPRDDT
jgi:hypothetical protein